MRLILNTFGLSLNRDNEAFVITKKGDRHRIPVEVLRKLQHSGLDDSPIINRLAVRADDMPTLQQRIDAILGLIHQTAKLGGKMLFFIMYDIESNKVRYNIVKYLERMGCYRIQKSIFLANLSMEKYERIKKRYGGGSVSIREP